jgi:hypothetical protein
MATLRARGDGQRLLFSVYISATAHTLTMVGIALASLRLPTCATSAPWVPPPEPIDVRYLGVVEKERPLELPGAKVIEEHHRAPKPKKKRLDKKISRVLTALENIKPRGPSTLKSLVSNIAAVRVAGGRSYRIAGVLSKLPDSRLQRARRLLREARGACMVKHRSFTFLLSVREDGTIRRAKISGDVPEAERRCIEGRAMRWRLGADASDDRIVVTP